ncbi:MAG: hypothetical protein K8J08_07480 [Thermoanaerobaculia bacterium]|nr:hypothetical protein [Thermoanaerobaculia bacterium]
MIPALRRTALLLSALLITFLTGPVAGRPASGSVAELEILFPKQADLFVGTSGVARLPLTPEILAECRPDLSDLRIFDADGNEVPYLADTGSGFDRKLEVTQWLEPEVLGIERQEVHRDDGPALQRETFRLAVPKVTPSTGHWDLVFHSRAREWVRTVEVSAPNPASGTRPIIRGSLWRLSGPRRERVRLTLPPLDSSVRELTVQLEGEDPTPLDPTFALESSVSVDPRRRIEVPLEEVGRRHEDGRTLVDLDKPRGLNADRLRLSTSTSSYHRRVEVWDEGPGRSEEALGGANLFRWNSRADIQDDELALRRAAGDRLRVVIEDGDSPPLDNLQFAAVLTGPVLLVDLKAPLRAENAGTEETLLPPRPAGVLRFGGGRAFRPNYDLSAMSPSLPAYGETVEIGLDLAEAHRLPTIEIGPIVANPQFDPRPALGFALRAGAPLDRGAFSHRRTVAVDASPEGLNRLPLQLDDLAVARRDLADLRVVDDAGNQRPYLLEPRATRLSLDLSITLDQAKSGSSRYVLTLPARPATLDRLILESEVPFFDRPYRLFAIGDADDTLLTEGRLVRRIGDPRPLTLAFAAQRVDGLALQIDDGDDAPLAWSSVRGRFPVPQLFFAAPVGSYELLLGDAEAETPRYELETVRNVALSIESALPTIGPLEPNPNRGFRWGTGGRLSRFLLWGAMGLAVLVLIALTLRLARAPEGA